MSTMPALFVAAHPDDETLAMGVAIAEHVAAGQDVHVLVLSDGEASGVTVVLNGTGVCGWWGVVHDPAGEGYAPLSAADLGAARVRESGQALACLSAGLPGTLTVHRAGLPDGAVTASAAQAAILAVADNIAPAAPVRLKGHTWVAQLDAHPDHIAAGTALKALSAADPARFGDRRHYLLPGYWSDPDLSLVAESWDTATDPGIAARARNATRCYAAWAPAAGAYAIGYHSRADWLDMVAANPRCLVHP